MSKRLMPDANGTRGASLASSFRFAATVRTFAAASSGKVYTMFLAVAALAQCLAIANVKPVIWEFRPRLDVVGVYPSFGPAANARPVVTPVNLIPPFFKLGRQARPVTLQRQPILPPVCERPNPRFTGTPSTAKLGRFVVGDEAAPAQWAVFHRRRVALGPARLRAVSSCLARSALKCGFADLACVSNTPPSFHGAGWSIHASYCTKYADVMQTQQEQLEPRYADVILKRAEAEGLTCERVDSHGS